MSRFGGSLTTLYKPKKNKSVSPKKNKSVSPKKNKSVSPKKNKSVETKTEEKTILNIDTEIEKELNKLEGSDNE